MDFHQEAIDHSITNTQQEIERLKRSKEGSAAEIAILLITNASDSPRTPMAMIEDAWAPKAFQETCQRFIRACTLTQKASVQTIVDELVILHADKIEHKKRTRDIDGLKILAHETRTLMVLGEAAGCAFAPS